MYSTILAIETSCDETSAAVVRGRDVLSNTIYSQMQTHSKYGGVVPGIAKLEHEKKIGAVIHQALEGAGAKLEDINAIAVTAGPGLAVALEVGVKHAKELASSLNIPLVPVNHMEGHMLSSLADNNAEPSFPVMGLLVSGKHSEFVYCKEIGSYEIVGSTLDDACGEAFDKVARMLGLEYPGGPVISKLAAEGRRRLDLRLLRDQQSMYVVARGVGEYRLPIPMALTPDLNMSYSGLKTASRQLIERMIVSKGTLSKNAIEELAAVFEEAAVQTLIFKLKHALLRYRVHEIWLGGGVVANKRLQGLVQELAVQSSLQVRLPADSKLLTDNAGMIGVAAGYKLLTNKEILYPGELDRLDRLPGVQIGETLVGL